MGSALPVNQFVASVINQNYKKEFTWIEIESLNDVDEIKADLVIVDLHSLKENSTKIILQLKNTHHINNIIAFHYYRQKRLINKLFDLGIQGYLPYQSSVKQTIDALETVLDNKIYIGEK